MADNLAKRTPQDSSRISTSEEWEVRYWTKELSVTEERLKELVREHGNSAAKVRDAIRREVGEAETGG
jgi:hypothetical protein